MKFGLAFIAASLATIGTPSLAAGTRRAAEITAAAAEDAPVLDNTSDLEALLKQLSETIDLPTDASSLSNIDAATAKEDFSTGASYNVDVVEAIGLLKVQVLVLCGTLENNMSTCVGMGAGYGGTVCAIRAILAFKAEMQKLCSRLLL